MYTVTEKKYASISKDYRGVYSSDDIHGTNLDGRRTLMSWIGGTCLLIEGESLIIVKTEDQNINPYDNPVMNLCHYDKETLINVENGLLYDKITLKIVGQHNT